jgi:hypothetical protein
VEIDVVSNSDDTIAIRKAVTAGFFYHTAKYVVCVCLLLD